VQIISANTQYFAYRHYYITWQSVHMTVSVICANWLETVSSASAGGPVAGYVRRTRLPAPSMQFVLMALKPRRHKRSLTVLLTDWLSEQLASMTWWCEALTTVERYRWSTDWHHWLSRSTWVVRVMWGETAAAAACATGCQRRDPVEW